MEKALREALIESIPELANNIYPTNAPETSTKPYLVYTRNGTQKTKTLEGFTGNQTLRFIFSIMATKYSDMKSLANKVEDFLMSLPGTSIGTEGIYIQDLNINNVTEQYEHELKVNRGIIDFTIYF
jgi:UDP-glucose 4-epimerase